MNRNVLRFNRIRTEDMRLLRLCSHKLCLDFCTFTPVVLSLSSICRRAISKVGLMFADRTNRSHHHG